MTLEELNNLKAARTAIITGANETRVEFEGKVVEYGPGNLNALNALIATGEAELSPKTKKLFTRIRTSKGL